MEIWQKLTDTLALELLRQFLASTSRTYWVYLLASLVLALALYTLGRERSSSLPAHLRSFSRASWLSRSAINDYGIILLNALIFAAVLDYFLPQAMPLSQSLARHLDAALPHLGRDSRAWAPLLLALCLFLVDDFLRYVVHYFEHKWPLLWELHKVHHSAEVLNFFTAERHHPISLFYFQFISIGGIVVVNAAFLALFQTQISPMAWLGGNIFWVLSNFVGGTLRHSSLWLSFGPQVEKWIISPAQHQIHHSDNPAHYDSNLGSTLAVWDRMFRTLYTTTSRREVLTYGIGPETAEFRSLAGNFAVPLRNIFTRLTSSGASNEVAAKSRG